ncbi:nicotinate-nucleotide--dimethylbenzimidazole phosphoribosyltransferase [Shigella flexneri]
MQILADFTEHDRSHRSTAMPRAQRQIDGLLKPVGSWESSRCLPYNWQECRGCNATHVGKKAVRVMRAIHGVWEVGVAISPKEVTAIQARR